MRKKIGENHYFYLNTSSMLEINGGPGIYIGSLKNGQKVKIISTEKDPMRRWNLHESGYKFSVPWINVEYQYGNNPDHIDLAWVTENCLKDRKTFIAYEAINNPEVDDEKNSSIRE